MQPPPGPPSHLPGPPSPLILSAAVIFFSPLDSARPLLPAPNAAAQLSLLRLGSEAVDALNAPRSRTTRTIKVEASFLGLGSVPISTPSAAADSLTTAATMSLSKASPTAPQSLRFVSHQLTSSHAAYPYGSTGNHTRTVPTSHPAFDLPSAASSSTSSPAASHPEHAVHAIAQFRVGDDDTSASGPSSCLIVARAVEQGCTLQVSILPLQPDGDAAFRPASTSQTQSTHALTSTQPQPQLFLFPAPLLPSVSIFVDHDTRRLYIIAVTVTGWLYRLAFALPHSIYASSYPYDWVTEHQIAALAAYAPSSVTSPSPSGRAPSQSTVSTADFGPRTPTMVHAPHPGLVVVACRDGTLIKMEQADSAEGPFKGEWCSSSKHENTCSMEQREYLTPLDTPSLSASPPQAPGERAACARRRSSRTSASSSPAPPSHPQQSHHCPTSHPRPPLT